MKQFARDNRYEFVGKKLPDGFLFRGTSLNDAEIFDVVKGTLLGKDMVVFSARFMAGNGHVVTVREQTVAAFPNVLKLGSRQVIEIRRKDFYLEAAGEWLVLYHRAKVVSKEQLPSWCETMHDIAQKMNSLVKERSAA